MQSLCSLLRLPAHSFSFYSLRVECGESCICIQSSVLFSRSPFSVHLHHIHAFNGNLSPLCFLQSSNRINSYLLFHRPSNCMRSHLCWFKWHGEIDFVHSHVPNINRDTHTASQREQARPMHTNQFWATKLCCQWYAHSLATPAECTCVLVCAILRDMDISIKFTNEKIHFPLKCKQIHSTNVLVVFFFFCVWINTLTLASGQLFISNKKSDSWVFMWVFSIVCYRICTYFNGP